MIRVLDAQFVATAVELKQAPGADLPEVAFVGRSNVGKSSMINALVQRRKLVRVSNTPGRTRTLNFFEVNVEQEGLRKRLVFADLPGYGFAKVSKTERQSWEKMVTQYLEKRRQLRVVVSIVDAEVGPTSEDQTTIEYLTELAPRILVVATKVDRLPKARRKPRLRDVAEALELPQDAVLAFSATDKIGWDDVWEALLGSVPEQRSADKPAGRL